MKLKEQQPSMNIDEQLENLKAIGLKIDDEDYARQILNDISYFRISLLVISVEMTLGKYSSAL